MPKSSPTAFSGIGRNVAPCSEIALQVVGDEKTAKHQAVQLVRLEREREKLMQAYYKEAISIDLLKKEQARIEGEIAAIQERINVNVEKLEDARTLVEQAMRILRSCYGTYKAADEATRQRLNQMLFSRIVVGGRQMRPSAKESAPARRRLTRITA